VRARPAQEASENAAAEIAERETYLQHQPSLCCELQRVKLCRCDRVISMPT
jgi:hypothetical protein